MPYWHRNRGVYLLPYLAVQTHLCYHARKSYSAPLNACYLVEHRDILCSVPCYLISEKKKKKQRKSGLDGALRIDRQIMWGGQTCDFQRRLFIGVSLQGSKIVIASNDLLSYWTQIMLGCSTVFASTRQTSW